MMQGFGVKLFKGLCLLWGLVACGLCQANCNVMDVHFSKVSYTNGVFSAEYYVYFAPHESGDVCVLDNLKQKSVVSLDGLMNLDAYLSLTSVTMGTPARSNIVNTPTCWCSNTSLSTYQSCNLQNAAGTSMVGSIKPAASAFKGCTPASTAFYTVTYNFTTLKVPPVAFKFCPIIESIQRGDGPISGNTFEVIVCAKAIPPVPTCSLNIASSVTFPTAKPSNVIGAPLTTKEVPVRLDCINNTGRVQTPRMVFSDATGRTDACYLQNVAPVTLKRAAVEVGVFADPGTAVRYCMSDPLSNFKPFKSIADGSTSSEATSFWVAMINQAADTTGYVQSILMIKMEYP